MIIPRYIQVTSLSQNSYNCTVGFYLHRFLLFGKQYLKTKCGNLLVLQTSSHIKLILENEMEYQLVMLINQASTCHFTRICGLFILYLLFIKSKTKGIFIKSDFRVSFLFQNVKRQLSAKRKHRSENHCIIGSDCYNTYLWWSFTQTAITRCSGWCTNDIARRFWTATQRWCTRYRWS